MAAVGIARKKFSGHLNFPAKLLFFWPSIATVIILLEGYAYAYRN